MRILGYTNRFTVRAVLAYLSLILIFRMPAFCGDSSNFDLAGPRIAITVTRSGKTLPISNVADLQAGDKLWIRPEFAKDQSVHYLLIVAFLQGSINPPPESRFIRVETWTKQIRQQGIIVTVPDGAEQAVLFLAPETGGDFSTLRSTVRGRPGVFVRATEDLEQASLDRTRLDKYVDEIRKTSSTDPSALKKRSTLLAQTLRIKVNEDCFNKPVEQQPSCLTENSDHLVIDDAHSQSLVASLTSGPSSDLIGALGSSPVARGGYYSPYVGAIVDAVRLLNNLHTAVYQYIPALSLPEKDHLNLKLNAAPSFQNPKSVLVVGLPGIEPTQLPPLRPVDAKQVLCLQQSPLVIPVEGAPLVFSTALGYSFVFRVEGKPGDPIDLPAAADAARGGFVVDTHALSSRVMSAKLTGTLRGFWGFSTFNGPEFQLRYARVAHWEIPSSDANALIVGRESTLHLQSDCAACVEKIVLQDTSGKDLELKWKALEPDQLEVELPMKGERAGPMKLKVGQFGLKNPDVVPLQAYSEAPHLEHFTFSAGDPHAVLTGTHLDEVACVEFDGICFMPAQEPHSDKETTLDLLAQNPSSDASLQPKENLSARVTLKDGRILSVPATIEPPRPKMTLVSKNLQQASLASPVHFGNPDELSQEGRLSLFLKTDIPAKFRHSEKIEIATADGSFDTMLSLADSTLILQDASSVLAVFDPLKAFGTAAFGPLRFRPVDGDGLKGEWQPIAVLVRIPFLKEIRCPDSPDKQCTLEGSNLFLLDSVASDPQFKDSVPVPADYVDSTLKVPRPNGTLLYIKLRDDPVTVDTIALPVLPDNR